MLFMGIRIRLCFANICYDVISGFHFNLRIVYVCLIQLYVEIEMEMKMRKTAD